MKFYEIINKKSTYCVEFTATFNTFLSTNLFWLKFYERQYLYKLNCSILFTTNIKDNLNVQNEKQNNENAFEINENQGTEQPNQDQQKYVVVYN